MKRTSKREPAVTETLRKAVRESGLTLYRVAKDSGVPYPTLYRFMTEERSITALTLNKLCAYLGLVLTKK